MLSEKLINASSAPTANWDLSYATFDGSGTGNKRIDQQTSRGTDIVFSPDGTKMYILNGSNANIYQYSMATAFDIGAATYDNKTKNITSQLTAPTSIAFSSDGTKMYAVGGNNFVHYYTLSTAWNVDTATYVSSKFHGVDNQVVGIFFNSSGTELYLTGDLNNRVFKINLNTAWDVTAYSTDIFGNAISTNFNFTTQSTAPVKTVFSSDGTKMFMYTQNRIYSYNLSTAWNVTTATFVTSFFPDWNGAFAFDSTGDHVIYTQWTTLYGYSYVTKRKLNTLWTVSPNTPISSSNALYISTSPVGVHLSGNGLNIYYLNSSSITSYSLSSAWDIGSTQTFLNSFNRASINTLTDIHTMTFNNAGTKLYVDSYNKIYQYNVSTPWALSTAGGSSEAVFDLGYIPLSLEFNNTGTKLLVTSNTSELKIYNLSTPWTINTASLSETWTLGFTASSTRFNNDGSKAYILNVTSKRVEEYRLWINYSFSGNKTFLNSYTFSSLIYTPANLVFKTDGSQFYVRDTNQITAFYRFRLE